MAKHGAKADDIFAGRTTPALAALSWPSSAPSRAATSRRRAAIPALDRAVLPAFLPVALVAPALARMEKQGPRPPLNEPVDSAAMAGAMASRRAAARRNV